MARRQTPLAVVEVSDRFKEVSGLTPVRSTRVLGTCGWRLGFWTVLDEPRVEDAVLLVGRRADATGDRDGWEVVKVHGRFKSSAPDTADGECVAQHDGFVYVFGSHFGSEEAGLDTDRAFAARFLEEDASVPGDPAVTVEVRKDRFRLHRAINDALVSHGLELLPIRRQASKCFIEATRRRGEREGTEWARRIHAGDWPLNVEGAAFHPNGNLLVGLRCPVTAAGHPIVVELDGFASTFGSDQESSRVVAVWVLDDIGSPEQPLGVRDLDAGEHPEPLSVIVGGLDRELFHKRDRDRKVPFAHWRTTLGGHQTGAGQRSELVQDFEDLDRLEGVARQPDGRFVYVTDEDRVVLRYVGQ